MKNKPDLGTGKFIDQQADLITQYQIMLAAKSGSIRVTTDDPELPRKATLTLTPELKRALALELHRQIMVLGDEIKRLEKNAIKNETN